MGCSDLPTGSPDVGTDAGADLGVTSDAIESDVPGTNDSGFPTAAHRAWPVFPENSRAILSPMTLVTIVTAGEPSAADLFAASDNMVRSAWWDAVGSEYGIAAAAGSVHVTGPAITGNLTYAQMATYISDLISAGDAPATDGNKMYLLYLPAGIAAVIGGVPNDGCSPQGIHGSYLGHNDSMAWVQNCPSMGARSTVQIQTLIGSHEVIESATDAIPGMGFTFGRPPQMSPWNSSVWYSYESSATSYTEVGDLCEGTAITIGGNLFQRSYSNRAALAGGDPCVPAIAAPYYNTTTGSEWYPATAGTVLDVSVTGWSTAATDDWFVGRFVRSQSDSTQTWGMRLEALDGRTTSVGGSTFPLANNGSMLTFHIAVPSNATSGSWAIFRLLSRRVDPATGASDPTGDQSHQQLFGVYVP